MREGLLLCQLHAHTTWSDGHLTLPELVDLYSLDGDGDVYAAVLRSLRRTVGESVVLA
jgi:hypothetical protein